MLAKNSSASMKPILTLVQILGASTFFQTLKETISLDNQQMFNLSLILYGDFQVFSIYQESKWLFGYFFQGFEYKSCYTDGSFRTVDGMSG